VSQAVDPLPPDPSSRPSLAEGVRIQPDRHGGGTVLLYPEGVLRLNPTGAQILGLCDGRRSIDEIVAVLAGTYVATDGDLRADVLEFLAQLSMRQLITLARK
jgi:pyrroloquinoline quinone biosynthesis protein D